MKKRGIVLLLFGLSIVIITIILGDFISKRPDKLSGNPYELNVDSYNQVDDSTLFGYNEIKNIKLDSSHLKGIAYSNNKIYILGNDFLQVISPEGKELLRKNLNNFPKCITVSDKIIYIGFIDHIESYTLAGELLTKWDTLDSNTVLTSLAVKDDLIFAADAGNRRVLRYKITGEYLGKFEGKSDTSLHGFIIPSPYFDLAINEEGELWVVNPGKHALEQYSYDGRLIGFWENASFNVEGFSGCCNPAQMAILPDGSFVTSEKGLVRIKVHKPSGELLYVVGLSDNFDNAFLAPDLAVTPAGLIYALDFDNGMIRVYQLK